ncbi:MAG: NYN domain-containing protein [Promethearchaeota archaeon]
MLVDDLAIELETDGRRTIPLIKSGNIITIHGKNGVGKSMAATLLEIASGNYIFENENRFNRLSKAIEKCIIKFYNNGQILYKVVLIPDLWRFDSNLNRVDPLTIGDYYRNENNNLVKINHGDFTKDIYIRTIRGNESLNQQIYFIKDIFLSKIDQKLDKLNSKLEFLKKYKEWLDNNKFEQIIENYNKSQTQYNDLLNKINNLDSSIKTREATLGNNQKAIDLLEKLLFISSNNIKDLNKCLKSEQDKINEINRKKSEYYKRLSKIEQELENLKGEFDKETKELINKRNKLKNQIDKLKDKLNSIEELDFSEIKDNYNKVETIKKEIAHYKDEIEKFKKHIEDLAKQNERVIEINKYLVLLSDLCGKASEGRYGNEKIIKIELDGIPELRLSFNELFKVFRENKLKFNQKEELKEYENKVEVFNHKIKKNREILKILSEYNKKLNDLKELRRKIKDKSGKIDDFIDFDSKINILESQKEELSKKIKTLEESQATSQNYINQINNKIEKIKDIPSELMLKTQLKELKIVLDSSKPLKEACDEKILELQKKIESERNKIDKNRFEKETLEKKVELVRKVINDIKNKIKPQLASFGFREVGEFIKDFSNHIKKFKKYLINTENLQKRLESLRRDIISVIEGKKIRNQTHLRIINDEFDKIFKELYNKEEFFKYVFQDYSKIKRFDIANKTIIFESKDGFEEARDLEEFSSGEKTYAYCRSIISMTANYAKYNIVILDESYALLDSEHSRDLYNFQKEMVRKKAITKFINILPLKEDFNNLIKVIEKNIEKENKLGNSQNIQLLKSQLEIIQKFQEDVDKKEYYQEIHYPDELREELPINYNFRIDTGQNEGEEKWEEEEEYEEEKLEFSFILDGSNIARNNLNSKRASIKDVLKCKRRLQEYGIPEKNIFIIFGAGLRHYLSPKDEILYNEIIKERNINQAPAGCDDDWFIINYAIENNSYIITNDRYLDYRGKSDCYDSFIESHLIHYTIIGNNIIFEEKFNQVLEKLNIQKH